MILIQNGIVYTMTAEEPVRVDLLVEDGKIQRIESAITPQAGWQVIDAAGLRVYPGFIDAHCHLGMSEEAIGFEGNDVNEATDPVTPQIRAIDGFNPTDRAVTEACSAGVTCVGNRAGIGQCCGRPVCCDQNLWQASGQDDCQGAAGHEGGLWRKSKTRL